HTTLGWRPPPPPEGEWLAVYTTDGKCVAMKQAGENVTVIPAAELPAGIYIVRGDKASAKFVK
ncbi:MAG: T9SS type A sorting domain-containing protein, partial [Muribaculaceae bacterium]|nr:T9SS type A sorting domain-containing protein [Muribaculaceae bacterium]